MQYKNYVRFGPSVKFILSYVHFIYFKAGFLLVCRLMDLNLDFTIQSMLVRSFLVPDLMLRICHRPHALLLLAGKSPVLITTAALCLKKTTCTNELSYWLAKLNSRQLILCQINLYYPTHRHLVLSHWPGILYYLIHQTSYTFSRNVLSHLPEILYHPTHQTYCTNLFTRHLYFPILQTCCTIHSSEFWTIPFTRHTVLSHSSDIVLFHSSYILYYPTHQTSCTIPFNRHVVLFHSPKMYCPIHQTCTVSFTRRILSHSPDILCYSVHQICTVHSPHILY